MYVLPCFPEKVIGCVCDFLYDRWRTFSVVKYLPTLELREKGYDMWNDREYYREIMRSDDFQVFYEWDSQKIESLRYLSQNERATHHRLLFPTIREIHSFLSFLLLDFPTKAIGFISS